MKHSIIRLIGTCLLLVLLDGIVQAQQRNIPLSEAISRIEKKFKTKFAYEHNLLNGKSIPASALNSNSVEEVLKNVLYPNNLLFLYVSGNSYSIVARDARFFQTPSPSQAPTPKPVPPPANQYIDDDQIVRGNITNAEGVALPFANIWVKGTRKGTTANEKGNYNLSGMKPGEHLVVTYVGYKDREVVVGGLGTINIIMEAHEGKSLNEVSIVSTGYQALPKERATGAFGVISAKELEKVPVPNVIQRLEGQIPGLDVQLTGGDNSFTYGNTQYGIASSTRTIGSSDYRLAIRGISTSQGDAMPLVVVDGSITTLDLKTFNPRDIESITVLKDAAAASIWGVRAANGVIVITTKKGNMNQAPRLSFSSDFMTSSRPHLNYLRLMSVDETIDYEQEAVNKGLIINPLTTTRFPQRVSEVTDLTFQLRAGKITQAQYDAALNTIRARGNGIDQISHYILQPTANQQYNLSLSGGSNSTTYYYGASYSKERTNTRGSDGQRLTLTLNNSFKVFDKVTIATNLKASMFKYKVGALSLNSLIGPSATTFMPYNQLVDADGNRIFYDRAYYGSYVSTLEKQGYLPWRYNYLDEMDFNDNSSTDNNYLATADVNVPLLKGLTANGFFSNERSFAQSRRYNSLDTYATRDLLNNATVVGTNGQLVTAIPVGGTLHQLNTQFNNYSLRGQLAYNRTFGMDHQVNAIAGTEIRQTTASQGSSTMYGYYMDRGLAQNVNYASLYSTLTGGQNVISGAPAQEDKTRRFLSYYANASYTLKNKYTLSGSVRYDDYNNFGLDRSYRATPLWSTGLKWNLDQENFLKNSSWINSLGLRTTYGVNGNIALDMYPFTSIYLGGSDLVTTNPYAGILNPANPTLRWENTYVFNVAVDFGLFNRRLNGSIDFYNKAGRDIIYEFPINPTYGINTLKRNSTTLSNKGIDVGLKADIIRQNDWTIQAGVTFAYNTNEVLDSRFVPTSSIYSNPIQQSWLKGYTTDKLLVYRFAGLDDTGMTQIYNENDEKLAPNQSITSINALKHVGRLTAPFFGGVNATLRYKGFSLYALATYSFGNVFIKPSIVNYPSAVGRNAQLRYDLSADIAKRWRNPGDELTTNVPGMAGIYAATSLQRFLYSDLNVLPGDFIRLREVSLTYQVAEKLSQMFGVKGASLGVAVRNLGLIWTKNKEGFDPMFASSLASTTLGIPPSPSYTFSLNVNF